MLPENSAAEFQGHSLCIGGKENKLHTCITTKDSDDITIEIRKPAKTGMLTN